MYYNVLQRATPYFSTYYNSLQSTAAYYHVPRRITTYYNVLRRIKAHTLGQSLFNTIEFATMSGKAMEFGVA